VHTIRGPNVGTLAAYPHNAFARPAMSAAVSIALWAGAGLTISALLAALAVALNRRMRIVDPVKGIDFDKVGLRRWLVDYENA
jgi:hypothetical protein